MILSGWAFLMTKDQPLGLLFSLAIILLFFGVPRNKLWFLAPIPKMSIDFLLSLRLNFIGFVCFFVISKFLFLLLRCYGVTMFVLLLLLLIRFMIPIQSTLRWITILFERKLFIMIYLFGSSPLRNKLLTCLPRAFHQCNFNFFDPC